MNQRVLIAAIILMPFMVFFFSALTQHRRIMRILRRIRELNPDKGTQLSSFDIKLVNILFVYNPIRFTRFLRSGDDLGDAKLKDEMKALRAVPWPAIIVWTGMALATILVLLVAFLKSFE